ncbi:hypothetical protein [Mesorhizobium sp. M0589]|uniref:hypothetical protein n=1 Tax=Mesorhizobium sp. M0589 TaxID=2956965 RepID=UPI00333D55F0
MKGRSYEWPDGLLLLRSWLKKQGVDVDHLKSERQVLFLGKRLSNMKGKLPPRQTDLFPLLLKLQDQHLKLKPPRTPRAPIPAEVSRTYLGTFGPASPVRHIDVADYLKGTQ